MVLFRSAVILRCSQVSRGHEYLETRVNTLTGWICVPQKSPNLKTGSNSTFFYNLEFARWHLSNHPPYAVYDAHSISRDICAPDLLTNLSKSVKKWNVVALNFFKIEDKAIQNWICSHCTVLTIRDAFPEVLPASACCLSSPVAWTWNIVIMLQNIIAYFLIHIGISFQIYHFSFQTQSN